MNRHPRLLSRDDAVLVVIDVQEAYRPVLFEYERVARQIVRLLQGATALALPVLITEQYPKGVGATVAEVAAVLPPGVVPMQKMTMSCWGAPVFANALRATGRTQVMIAGIEAHACVNQTAHDLLAAGYQVHVARDAISSRHRDDYALGWEKMTAAGVVPASVESALLELLRTAEAPEFKVVQRIIR